MSRYAVLCFEHDRRIQREIEPPCFELDIDVSIPWTWVDEATIGEVRSDGTGSVFEGTLAKITKLAEIYQPACPACKELLRNTAWSVEDYQDDAEGSKGR